MEDTPQLNTQASFISSTRSELQSLRMKTSSLIHSAVNCIKDLNVDAILTDVALDLTAAFDNVDHQQLLICVFNTNILATIRRWLCNYMLNRRDKVYFRQKESKSRNAKTGVVQGAMSPALMNYHLAYFPTAPPNIKLIKYADYIIIYTSGPVVADLINDLNIYLSQVRNYVNAKKQTVSTGTSTVTLFTPDTHKHHLHPQVKMADQVLPLEKRPNVLAVMLDTHITFTQHCTISQ